MLIILNTDSTNPEFHGDCDCAVVDLAPELVDQIQRRVELARQLGQEHNDLYEVYFWDGMADFYEGQLIEACEEALAAAADGKGGEQVVQDWLTGLEENGHAPLPPGVDLAAHKPQRTECDQMILRCGRWARGPEFEIAWTTSPKHTDVYVTTRDLPLAALEGCVRQAQAAPA